MKHQLHEEAARYYTEAANHHIEANKSLQDGNDERAAYHAQAAKGHSLRAMEKSNEADKAHADKQIPKKKN